MAERCTHDRVCITDEPRATLYCATCGADLDAIADGLSGTRVYDAVTALHTVHHDVVRGDHPS